MKTNIQKLYCFVDETGQDTKGKFFLVAVVLKGVEDLETLQEKLTEIEKLAKKKPSCLDSATQHRHMQRSWLAGSILMLFRKPPYGRCSNTLNIPNFKGIYNSHL